VQRIPPLHGVVNDRHVYHAHEREERARVIEDTIRQKLPEGFQRSEFLLEKGFLDAVVHRKDMKQYIARALDFMSPNGKH